MIHFLAVKCLDQCDILDRPPTVVGGEILCSMSFLVIPGSGFDSTNPNCTHFEGELLVKAKPCQPISFANLPNSSRIRRGPTGARESRC